MKNHSHIYLHAKGWYKETDVFDDISKIISRECAIDAKYITKRNVFDAVTEIAIDEIVQSPKAHHAFKLLMRNMLGQNLWKINATSEDSRELIIIKSCLSILANTRVGISDLPNPDYSILPPRPENE